MAAPLIPFDAPDGATHPQVIFNAILDDRYIVEVQRTGGATGNLLIFDHDRNDQEIFSQAVGLSYGAKFGPDISDVEDWEMKVADFIDNTYDKK